jgi:hypothetical protein
MREALAQVSGASSAPVQASRTTFRPMLTAEIEGQGQRLTVIR